MATAKLTVIIGAEIDKFIKDTERAFSTLEANAKKMQKVGMAMTQWVTLPALAAGAAILKMSDTENTALAQLESATQGMANAWGKLLMPAVIAGTQGLAVLAEKAQQVGLWFQRLSPNTRAVVGAVALLAVAAGPTLMIFGKLLQVWTAAVPVMRMLGLGLNAVSVQVAFLGAVALIAAANWEKTKALMLAVVFGIGSALAGLISKMLKFQSVILTLNPILSFLFRKAAKVAGDVSEDLGTKFLEASSRMEQGGGWMQNTFEAVGGSIRALTKDFTALAVSASAATGATAVIFKTNMDRVNQTASEMKNSIWTVAEQMKMLSDGIAASFTNAITNSIVALAEGTFTLKDMLKSLFVEMLRMTVEFAVKKLTIFQTIAEGMAALMVANPFVAIAVIAGLMAGIAGLTMMASGGVVTGPTPALIGEAGPEAVIPLSSPRAAGFLGGGGGQRQEINIYLDGRQMAQAVVKEMPSVVRVQGVFR